MTDMFDALYTVVYRFVRRLWFFGGPTYRMDMYERFATLIRDGLEIQSLIEDNGNRLRARRSRRAHFYLEMQARIEEGETFSSILEDWAPASEVIVINAAERAGRIEDGFSMAAHALTTTRQVQTALLGALAYPSGSIMTAIIMMILFARYFVPLIASFKDPSTWSGSASTLYTISMFFDHYLVVILSGLILLGIFVYWSLAHYTPSWRSTLDRFPPWNLYRIREGAMFLGAYAAMLNAGIGEYDAIEHILRRSKPWLKRHVMTIRHRMEDDGAALGDALDLSLFTQPMRDEIADYARLSNADIAMQALGRRAMVRGLAQVKSSSRVITVFMMVLVMAFLTWVGAAFFGVVMSIADSLSH